MSHLLIHTKRILQFKLVPYTPLLQLDSVSAIACYREAHHHDVAHTHTRHEHYVSWIISNMEQVSRLLAATLECNVFEFWGVLGMTSERMMESMTRLTVRASMLL